MRRPPSGGHESHERWLVSYADFITLLFAFFVVMFASTQADKEKARQVSASVKAALENGQLVTVLSAMLGRGKHQAAAPASQADLAKLKAMLPPSSSPSAPADLSKSLETLKAGLVNELASGKIALQLETRGLVISLRESAFFASGDDAIASASVPILAKIAEETGKMSNPLRLEGHTDSVPIHTARFRSNWELSAARAISMMELFRQNFGIAPERMSVAGYAENAPADTNDTAVGREHNRRVDLVILSEEGAKSEPQSAGQGAAKPSPAAAPPGKS